MDASPSAAGSELREMGRAEGYQVPRWGALSHRHMASGKGGGETQGWREEHCGLPGLLSLPRSQRSPLFLHHGEIREASIQGHKGGSNLVD